MDEKPKKLTVGDLLQQKQNYDNHTFDKWDEELKSLVDLAKSGDASATQVLLKLALTTTEAIEKLVIEEKPPICFFSATASIWPVIQNASPHIPLVIPKNLGKYAGGPFDLTRVFKTQTESREIMIYVLLLIHYLREHHQTIRLQEQNMAERREWGSTITHKVKVPGGNEDDVFDWTTYLQPTELLTYEFHLHALILSQFGALLEYLNLPSLDATVIFSYQNECVALPDMVDSSWRALTQKILKDLTGETLSESPTLHRLGKDRVGRKTNKDGKPSKSTGDVEDVIRSRLNGAFDAICKECS